MGGGGRTRTRTTSILHNYMENKTLSHEIENVIMADGDSSRGPMDPDSMGVFFAPIDIKYTTAANHIAFC